MAEELFDRAEEYDAMLARGLRLSGEDKAYFRDGRLRSLLASLPEGFRPRRILDFGCGTGDTADELRALVPGAEVVGVDTSERALAVARESYPGVRFAPVAKLDDLGPFDLCYVNGVFHHIAPPRRGEAMRAILDALRAGGYLGLFENNGWNPGARLVMRRIPFDPDAVVLTPPETRRLVAAAGFGPPIRTRSLFYFPRPLAFLRFLEPALARLPLGAQIQVVAQKPSA
jgi:SAM-dependent methyltransferase